MAVLDPFPVLEIPDDAPEQSEHAGTKTMFWFRHEGRRGLFKRRRRKDSGEDWAEKVAAELAALVGVPAAKYDLAVYQGAPGVVSWSIADPPLRALVLGNQVLARSYKGYPLAPSPHEGRRVRLHTVRHMLGVCWLVGVPPAAGLPADMRGTDVAVGYLLFDAWIGNTDRHHRNWGWVVDPTHLPAPLYIAPSFDHGSSLGHALSDGEREKRIRGRDPGCSVAGYLRRGRSRFWGSDGHAGWLHPKAAFEQAKAIRPRAAAYWQARLRGVTDGQVDEVLGKIPHDRMSAVTSEFCRRMLMESRRQVENA